MNLKAIFSAIGVFFVVLFYIIFGSYKRGKETQRQDSNDKAIKEALEIKKNETVNANDDISNVRDRLRKHARD
jgi:uncharacterized membrane protein